MAIEPAPSTENGTDRRDPWRRTRFGLFALLGVIAVGTVVYRLLGLGWVDAYYQTVITVTTVGYTEVGEEITTTYRIATSLIVLFGVGVALYTIGVTFESFMEGQLSDALGRNRRERALENLTDHVIVCGYGQVGRAITRALEEAGEQVVVIDKRPDLSEVRLGHAVVGDATLDDTLHHAGVTRARGIVIALDEDADAMYVTVSARALNNDLHIVCRVNKGEAARKLTAAGANEVVNPHELGGAQMAVFMIEAIDAE